MTVAFSDILQQEILIKANKPSHLKKGCQFLIPSPASVGDKLDPVVYNYEIKDGILYLYADGTTTKEGLLLTLNSVSNKFKKQEKKQKGEAKMFKKYMKAFLIACCSLLYSQDAEIILTLALALPKPLPLMENGKLLTLEVQLNVVYYQDFDEEKATLLSYSDGWKDLAPTLNISNNKVEFEYTAPMRTCLGNFYDYYLKKYSASTISKDGFIKARFRKLKQIQQLINPI